jgi:hypothetical protein
VRRLDGVGRHAHPRPRRKLSETMEGLEMRLGEKCDHRDSPAFQHPLDLRTDEVPMIALN